MFMGEYRHSLDTKGRLIIPVKFREKLTPTFVLTRGMDGCLFGYPQSEWQKIATKLQSLPLTKKDARAFVRFFMQRPRSVNLISRVGLTSLVCYASTHNWRKSAWLLGFLIGLKFGLRKTGLIFVSKPPRILMRLLRIWLILNFKVRRWQNLNM